MSAPRRVADVERTATMLDLLHRQYENSGAVSRSHVVIDEVAPGTGFSAAQRWADVLVLSVWPSNGLTLDGYEIKASKADLKRELADPKKHQAVSRYCDTWTLLAWDESILVDGIPDWWGIDLTREKDGGRELFTHRGAAERVPDAWPRGFVCSLVRNAFEQSPGAAYVGRACDEASRNAYRQGKKAADDAALVELRPLIEALYGKSEYRWPREARQFSTLAKRAVEKLEQPVFTGVA